MSRIRFKAKAVYKNIRTQNFAALLDSGAHSCYIDNAVADLIGVKNLKKSHVGLGYKRERWGPFHCGFIIDFRESYRGVAKTYVIDFSKESFDILLGNVWLRKTKLPIQKILERENMLEY